MKNKGSENSVILILTLALFVGFYSCHSKENDEQITVLVGTPVKVVHPFVKNMINYLQLNGTTVFLKKEIVRAPFQGYIQKTFKNVGDAVKIDDVLFLLQTKESFAINTPSEKNSNTDNLSVPIKSKSNGILTHLNFYSGGYVSDGEQLASIAIPNSLVVMLDVPYQNSSEIKIGEKCDLLLPDKRVMPGVISRSIPSVDSISQTQTYIISFKETAIIPENLNLTVRIPIHTLNNATVVPKGTILSNETLSSFWIMKLINDTTAIRVNIKKGIEDDSLVQVLNPKLSQGDKIISDGNYGLPDTAKINIEKQ